MTDLFIFASLNPSPPYLVANLRLLEITDYLEESTPLIWLVSLVRVLRGFVSFKALFNILFAKRVEMLGTDHLSDSLQPHGHIGLPDSSVHGILQAPRILEWVTILSLL